MFIFISQLFFMKLLYPIHEFGLAHTPSRLRTIRFLTTHSHHKSSKYLATMNLRFRPTTLLTILSIHASERNISRANVDAKKYDSSTFSKENHAKIITTSQGRTRPFPISSTLNKRINIGRSFYNPDVGVLKRPITNRYLFSGAQPEHGLAENIPRYLQAEANPICGTNGTCFPSFCADVGSRFTVYSAATELNAICNGYTDANGKKWTFEGCFKYYSEYPGYQEYQKKAFCQLSKCVVDGGSTPLCYCQVYNSACEMYGDERPYDPYSPGFCKIAACCKNKTTDYEKATCLSGYPHNYSSRNQYRQENPRCGINGTCESSVCSCRANYGGSKKECVSSFNDICNGITDVNGSEWTFEGCYRDYPDYPDFQLYHKTLYCGLTKCVADGGMYTACYCQVQHTLCEMFGDVRKYNYDPTMVGFCTFDTCCQNKSTEAGRMACYELTNSTPTTPTVISEEGQSNPSNASSTSEGETADSSTSEQTSANVASSVMPQSSARTTSALITTAAAFLWL